MPCFCLGMNDLTSIALLSLVIHFGVWIPAALQVLFDHHAVMEPPGGWPNFRWLRGCSEDYGFCSEDYRLECNPFCLAYDLPYPLNVPQGIVVRLLGLGVYSQLLWMKISTSADVAIIYVTFLFAISTVLCVFVRLAERSIKQE